MSERVKTAIVFGKGPVAIRATQLLIRESYQVQFVVPSSSEIAGSAPFADWAVDQGLVVRRLERLDELPYTHIELGISAYFDRIFRAGHINRFGMLVNVHNSMLPRYRGVRPINWALKNGETLHGVSLHEITPGIDEGPVLDQEAFEIDPSVDEVRDVYHRCLTAAETMLERAIPDIWDLQAVDQDERAASYYSSSDDESLGDRRYWARGDTRFE